MILDAQCVIGWDVGGAHVKACVLRHGEVVDVAQWPCPLWLGLQQLGPVLDAAGVRWSGLGAAQHAVTMTGEMVDWFANREDGVRRIAAELAHALPAGAATRGALHFFAGDAGWRGVADVAANWEAIASANWLATARHAALCIDAGSGAGGGEGVLVDIGSTTTDLVAFRGGRVLTRCRSDAQRLACGELVYHGVVRTPLCAVTQRIDWRGEPHNVMNEFFASAADVYRLTGELDPAHDQHPSADNAAKDRPATQQRLARMIGLDARDATADEWLAFAQSWRRAQVSVIGGELTRVLARYALGPAAAIVSAGCGSYLVPDVLEFVRGTASATPPANGATPSAARRIRAYGTDVARIQAQAGAYPRELQRWTQVCAPCVAVAALFDRDHR